MWLDILLVLLVAGAVLLAVVKILNPDSSYIYSISLKPYFASSPRAEYGFILVLAARSQTTHKIHRISNKYHP